MKRKREESTEQEEEENPVKRIKFSEILEEDEEEDDDFNPLEHEDEEKDMIGDESNEIDIRIDFLQTCKNSEILTLLNNEISEEEVEKLREKIASVLIPEIFEQNIAKNEEIVANILVQFDPKALCSVLEQHVEGVREEELLNHVISKSPLSKRVELAAQNLILRKLFAVGYRKNSERWNNYQKQVIFINFRLEGKKLVLPYEILSQILEYLPKTRDLLDGAGLANKRWNRLVLQEFGEVIITSENVRKVPPVVLALSHTLLIDLDRLRDNSLEYLFGIVNKLKVLQIFPLPFSRRAMYETELRKLFSSLSSNQYWEKFKSCESVSVPVLSLNWLRGSTYSPNFENSKFFVPFPKVKHLRLQLHTPVVQDSDILRDVEKLELYSLINQVVRFEPPVVNAGMLNLKELKISKDVYLNVDALKFIYTMKNLRKLKLFIVKSTILNHFFLFGPKGLANLKTLRFKLQTFFYNNLDKSFFFDEVDQLVCLDFIPKVKSFSGLEKLTVSLCTHHLPDKCLFDKVRVQRMEENLEELNEMKHLHSFLFKLKVSDHWSSNDNIMELDFEGILPHLKVDSSKIILIDRSSYSKVNRRKFYFSWSGESSFEHNEKNSDNLMDCS